MDEIMFTPMTRPWTGTRAALFVHGVGNARPGDYTQVVTKVRDSLASHSQEPVALYELYYDVFNDWAAEKFALAGVLGEAVSLFGRKARASVDDELAEQIAETAGDVLLPAFSQSARLAVRDAYVLQLQQMVSDGRDAGVKPQDQRLSIICHSLGCFHTFETLHAVARDRSYELHPTLNLTKFQTVILMASPLKLIRTAFDAIGASGDLATLAPSLTQPGDPAEYNGSVRTWVSITGNLDPIGGYFLRKQAPWAYTDVESKSWRGTWASTCTSIVDPQQLTGTDASDEVNTRRLVLAGLRAVLSPAGGAPSIPLKNPHSWGDYVDRYRKEIAGWLLA